MENNNEAPKPRIPRSYEIKVEDDPDSDEDEAEQQKKQEKQKTTATTDKDSNQDCNTNRSTFVIRDSPVTQLIREDASARGVYCILFVVFSCFFWTKVMEYMLDPELRERHGKLLSWLFTEFHYTLYVWAGMKLSVTVVVYLIAKTFAGSSGLTFLTIIIELMLTLVTPLSIYFLGIRYLSVSALFCEQIRLQLKVVAFVSGVSRKYGEKQQNDIEMKSQTQYMTEPFKMPSLSSYVYFLFAPTLVFQEEYPKSKSRNIFRILVLIYEILVLLLCVFTTVQWVITPLSVVGKQPLTPKMIVTSLFPTALLGLTIMLSLFYGFYHSWPNIWSEILKFGDRQFYCKFWAEPDPQALYRKWNLIISNCCYSYILLPLVKRGWSRTTAISFIFFVSAVAHETLIGLSMGFFMPIIFIFACMFIPYAIFSSIFSSIIKKINARFTCLPYIIVWSSFTMFWIFIVFGNLVEFYSRENCPRSQEVWYDLIYPRTLSCVSLTGIPQGSIRKILEYFIKVV